MLQKLENDKTKVPSPSKDKIMSLACNAMEKVSFDKEKAFKSLFLTNSLNGSEDFMVSDRIFSLIGQNIKKIWEKLMNEPCPKIFKSY